MLLKNASQSSTSPKVCLLGAKGFVASSLTAFFQSQGIDCRSISSSEIDLTSESSVPLLKQMVSREETLVFISALTPDRGRDFDTFLKNLLMAKQVSAFLEERGCAHLVYISSDAVYSDNVSLVREDSCADPGSFHGMMHIAREKVLGFACEKAKIPLLILRPCALYGPGDTHNSYGPNRFVQTAMDERQIKLFGEGEEKRDHLFIDDFCRLAADCVLNRCTGCLNAANGISHSFFEVAKTVIDNVGSSVKLECSARNNPVSHRHFDITELQRAFPGFAFTPLGEGIRRTIAWRRGKV